MIITPNNPRYFFFEGWFYKIFRAVMSRFYHAFGLRLPSNPYLTGDSFRALADHIYDETTTFLPEVVKRGDTVFLGNTVMEKYFRDIHPHITEQYILIEHNGDYPVDEHIAAHVDEKIFHFYAQCTEVLHEKISPIPIGVSNKHHGYEGFPYFMERTLPAAEHRKPRIFYHFTVANNPSERGPALAYCSQQPLMDTIKTFFPYGSYKDLLASYCFVASPAGNTHGSHRTWEALYLRTIPIVKRSIDADYCVSNGLPLWIINDWSDLDAYDEKSLKAKYDEIMKTARFETLYMDYWIKRIQKDQATVRAGA